MNGRGYNPSKKRKKADLMTKSRLIISLAAAGLLALGGYSVFAENSGDSWNSWCYGPRQTVSQDSRDGSYGRGYGCGGYRQSDRDDYYCPGPGYRR